MLNFIFAFYICLIPLLLIWASGVSIKPRHSAKSKNAAKLLRMSQKRPVAALKLAANERNRQAVVYQAVGKANPEYYDLSELKTRRVSYFPGAELNLITDKTRIRKKETAVG